MAASPVLPRRLQLPSGRTVSFLKTRCMDPPKAPPAQAPLFDDAVAALGTVGLMDGSEPVDPLDLCLADFHTLRAALTRAGWLHEDTESIACHNCEVAMDIAPCAAFEWGHHVAASLGDPELDETLPFDQDVSVPGIELADGTMATTVRFSARTVRQALPLFRALASPSLVINGGMVRAMGVAALGSVTGPRHIARALSACSDDAWQAVTDAYLAAHYPPRLFSWWRCDACGARNDVDAPMLREFDMGARPMRDAPGAFMDEESFARRASEMFTSLRPDPKVRLVVDNDVPACDDGGEPLLGSYVPEAQAMEFGPVVPATVTVYYRTFRAVWESDESFDVEAELQETLEHELTHHRYALLGHDPMDEDEHDEIDREAERVVGQRELMRRSVSALGADLGGFLRRTWWLWVVVVALSALAALRG